MRRVWWHAKAELPTSRGQTIHGGIGSCSEFAGWRWWDVELLVGRGMLISRLAVGRSVRSRSGVWWWCLFDSDLHILLPGLILGRVSYFRSTKTQIHNSIVPWRTQRLQKKPRSPVNLWVQRVSSRQRQQKHQSPAAFFGHTATCSCIYRQEHRSYENGLEGRPKELPQQTVWLQPWSQPQEYSRLAVGDIPVLETERMADATSLKPVNTLHIKPLQS